MQRPSPTPTLARSHGTGSGVRLHQEGRKGDGTRSAVYAAGAGAPRRERGGETSNDTRRRCRNRNGKSRTLVHRRHRTTQNRPEAEGNLFGLRSFFLCSSVSSVDAKSSL